MRYSSIGISCSSNLPFGRRMEGFISDAVIAFHYRMIHHVTVALA